VTPAGEILAARAAPARRGSRLRRSLTYRVRRVLWTISAASRPLPDFLIIGAQKAGTSSLYWYLDRHPLVRRSLMKEVEFFTLHHHRGERWYRSWFPRRRAGDDWITGEATPYYLFHPAAAERAARLVPRVRAIAVLRDPVERCISHYHHERVLGRESLPLEEALERETQRLDGEERKLLEDDRYRSMAHQSHSYRSRGLYAPQLQRWFDALGREQVLVLLSEDLYQRPAESFRTVSAFLGIPPIDLDEYPAHNSRVYPAAADHVVAGLERFYAPHNQRLAALLGRELPW